MRTAHDPVVVSDEAHRQHDPPYELNAGQHVSPVPERPARLDAIATAVRAAGLKPRRALPHDDALITAVHDPGMVDFLRDCHAAWVAAGGPSVMIPDTFRSPRWARGGRLPASPLGRAGRAEEKQLRRQAEALAAVLARAEEVAATPVDADESSGGWRWIAVLVGAAAATGAVLWQRQQQHDLDVEDLWGPEPS